MKIAIVGGGIGGLVLALALRERGVDFEVYEQADELREIGAAVALSANGTRELRRLGLGEQVEAVSVVPSRARDPRRATPARSSPTIRSGRDGTYEATFGAPYYGVHRVALLQALGDRLGGDGLHLGRRCVGVEERASGVELRFANGASATADVVVGADGVHSVIRPHVAGRVRGRYSGTVGYRGLVPVEDDAVAARSRRRCSSGPGPGRHLLHYAIDGGRTVNFLAVVRVPEWTNDAWMEECAVDDAVDAFAGWHPAVTEMVGATDVGARWALHDLAPLRALAHRPRRADRRRGARDGAPPGSGRQPDDRGRDRARRLPGRRPRARRSARYAALRRKRTTAVQWLSRRTADLMHLPDGPEIAPRDALFRELYSGLAWIHSHDAQDRSPLRAGSRP